MVLVLSALATVAVFAQPADTEQERKESRARLTEIAASYTVKVDGKRIAILREEPLFGWDKSISEIEDAILFVWTLAGRPVAASAFLRLAKLGHCHEFQSLSR